jgi:hypothetical protein
LSWGKKSKRRGSADHLKHHNSVPQPMDMMRIFMKTVTDPSVLKLGWMVLALSVQPSHGTSLFGDHACTSWQSLGYAQKGTWTNAFLAPLSLTLKGVQKSKEDKYNDDPKAHETAITSIDAFCLNHPEMNAADGAGRYLKKLMAMPSN